MTIDLNQIADQIRQEAFEKGYEACLKDMAAFLDTRNVTFLTATQNRQTTPSGRAPRGQAKELVVDALRNMTVIGTAKNVQSYLGSRGHSIPYSSIQNAMMQLIREGAVETVGRGIWRLKTNTPPTVEEGGVSMG